MSCGTCLSKFGLTILNLFFLAAGGGLIFLGSFMFKEYASYGGVHNFGMALLPAFIIIGVGVLAIFLAIFGCTATFSDKKCLTGLYFALLLVMLLGLIAGVIVSLVYRCKIEEGLHGIMEYSLNNYHNNSDIKAQVDLIQKEFQCCGVDNSSDWLKTPWFRNQSNPYPASCCEPKKCTYWPRDDNLHGEGCLTLVSDKVKHYMLIIASVIGGIAIVLVIGMLMTCVLLMHKRRQDTAPYTLLDNEQPQHHHHHHHHHDGMRI